MVQRKLGLLPCLMGCMFTLLQSSNPTNPAALHLLTAAVALHAPDPVQTIGPAPQKINRRPELNRRNKQIQQQCNQKRKPAKPHIYRKRNGR